MPSADRIEAQERRSQHGRNIEDPDHGSGRDGGDPRPNPPEERRIVRPNESARQHDRDRDPPQSKPADGRRRERHHLIRDVVNDPARHRIAGRGLREHSRRKFSQPRPRDATVLDRERDVERPPQPEERRHNLLQRRAGRTSLLCGRSGTQREQPRPHRHRPNRRRSHPDPRTVQRARWARGQGR